VELAVSVLGALFKIAGIAFLGLCGYSLWRAAREGSRAERALVAMGVLCLLAVCFVPASIGGYRGVLPMAMFITAAWVVWAARAFAATAFVALAVSSRLNGRRRGLQTAVLALFVFGPFSECARFASDPAPWQEYSTLEHPSGRRFAFVESSFMQGQLLAVARVDSQRWYGTDYTAVVLTNGDSPRSYVSLVRPDKLDDPRYGQLQLLRDGRIVAVRSRNHAYMAFDPGSGQHWDHESIYELSPFVMLDAHARLSAKDMALTTEEIVNRCTSYTDERAWLAEAVERGSMSGVPSARLLRSELDHLNPAVRIAAQQLLDKLQEQCLVAVQADH
jgi:hypothetical protein